MESTQSNPLVEPTQEMGDACLRAILLWGEHAQIIQAMGECGEFISSCGKYYQGRDPDMESITEEACDVVILMMQIREIVGHGFFDNTLRRKFSKFVSKMDEAT